MKKFKQLTAAFIILVLSFKAPEIHRGWLRNKVSSTVVRITNQAGNSGGTGAYVKAPSGNVYILTNAHVCGVVEGNEIYVSEDGEAPIPRRILERSNFTDLCLIEALPNYTNYLNLGSEPNAGQEVYILGHPELMPNTMTSGEFISYQDIVFVDHMMLGGDDGSCDLPKNKMVDINSIFGPIKLCLVDIVGGGTTALILPGNSGSPVVDYYGKLIGLAFAGNKANWGFFVTLPDIRKVLKNY